MLRPLSALFQHDNCILLCTSQRPNLQPFSSLHLAFVVALLPSLLSIIKKSNFNQQQQQQQGKTRYFLEKIKKYLSQAAALLTPGRTSVSPFFGNELASDIARVYFFFLFRCASSCEQIRTTRPIPAARVYWIKMRGEAYTTLFDKSLASYKSR